MRLAFLIIYVIICKEVNSVMQQDMALASDSLDSVSAGGSSLTADSLASDASGGSLASSGTGTDLASGGGVTGLASGGAVESMTLDPSGQATKGVPQTTDRALQLETIPNQAVDQLPQNTTTQGQIQSSNPPQDSTTIQQSTPTQSTTSQYQNATTQLANAATTSTPLQTTTQKVCASCGAYGFCLENNTVSGCNNCACPEGYTGQCCETDPPPACAPSLCPTNMDCVDYPGGRYQCVCSSGYYGVNCTMKKYDVGSCTPQNGTALFLESGTESYTTEANNRINPKSLNDCGYGDSMWCLNTTESTSWVGNMNPNSYGDQMEIMVRCPSICIRDVEGNEWQSTDTTQNNVMYFFRPYCSTTLPCGVYVFMSYIDSSNNNNRYPNTSLGLMSTNPSGQTRLIYGEYKNGSQDTPIDIGPDYNYIRAIGVACNGCPVLYTDNCNDGYPTTPPCTANCKNGGMCVIADNGTSYCECLNIYTGSDCSEFASCTYFSSNPLYACKNGGTCISSTAIAPWYECVCLTGYCGPECQLTQTECDPTTTETTIPISTSSKIPATLAPAIGDIIQNINQSNFNRDYLPYVIANMTTEQKMNASWHVQDLYMWASYEGTELNIYNDLTPWYENSMGNCFTFNHENSSKIYKLRYAGERGGFKAQMRIKQTEYMDWVLTASLLVFFHRRQETIMGESVSYQIAPGEETSFVIERNAYKRLRHPYGKCIRSISEVKSYYNPGSAYTIDSCIRSCYQDYVQEKCNCMDPKYYMATDAVGCDMSKKACVDNITLERGEPSTWPECVCLPPCEEYIYDVQWSKTVFRSSALQCGRSNATSPWDIDDDCQFRYSTNMAIFSVYFPRLFHKKFVEKPKISLNEVFVSLMNLTGLIMGLSIISLVEIIFLMVRFVQVLCLNKSAINSKMEYSEHREEKEANAFNNPKYILNRKH